MPLFPNEKVASFVLSKPTVLFVGTVQCSAVLDRTIATHFSMPNFLMS